MTWNKKNPKGIKFVFFVRICIDLSYQAYEHCMRTTHNQNIPVHLYKRWAAAELCVWAVASDYSLQRDHSPTNTARCLVTGRSVSKY